MVEWSPPVLEAPGKKGVKDQTPPPLPFKRKKKVVLTGGKNPGATPLFPNSPPLRPRPKHSAQKVKSWLLSCQGLETTSAINLFKVRDLLENEATDPLFLLKYRSPCIRFLGSPEAGEWGAILRYLLRGPLALSDQAFQRLVGSGRVMTPKTAPEKPPPAEISLPTWDLPR